MESHRASGGRGPKRRRLSRSAEFERVYRQGRSKGNRFLVLYAFPREDGADEEDGPRLGLSVSRRVGGAVDRNRVKRRLRHLVRSRLAALPEGTDLVVRTQPGAADRSASELADDLDAALAAAMRPRVRR